MMKHSELRAFRNQAAAQLTGTAREKKLRELGFSTTEVASGDAKRRKDYLMAEAREKAGKMTDEKAAHKAAKKTAQNTAKTVKLIGTVFHQPLEADEE